MDLSFIFHTVWLLFFSFSRLVCPSKKRSERAGTYIFFLCLVMYYILTTRNVVVIEAIPCVHFVLVIKTIMICSVCGNCLDLWVSFYLAFFSTGVAFFSLSSFLRFSCWYIFRIFICSLPYINSSHYTNRKKKWINENENENEAKHMNGRRTNKRVKKKNYYAFEHRMHINWLWSEFQQEQNNLIYM